MKPIPYYKARIKHFINYNIKTKIYFFIKYKIRQLTIKSKLGLPFPKEINLSGRMFNIQEHEGLITFSAQGGFYGSHERLSFTHPKYALWQIEHSTTFKYISPSLILKAYKIICDYRADNFNRDMAVNGEL